MTAHQILTNPADVEEYRHVFADLSEKSRQFVVLGERDNYEQPQKILILRDEAGENMSELKIHLLTLRERIKKKGHQVSIRRGSDQLINLLYERYADTSQAVAGERTTEYQVMFENVLSDALQKGASDIHIEVRRNEANVRYRVFGELVDVGVWASSFALRMAQVIYSVYAEEVDVTFRQDQPQDGLIDRYVDGERLRIRVATIPAAPDGFDMIMRLLSLGKQGVETDLVLPEALGYSADQTKAIYAGIARPVGATIISGTTGSGKSTTLKNLLLGLIKQREGRSKVITVEDPPEYFIPGATQVPVVRNKASESVNPFHRAIRGAMRADPDVIMVGEVRDELTADLLVGAVQSGHKVFSTVHAPSAIGIISRFASRTMGIDRDILGSPDFLSCLIYQSLLPVLCDDCKVSLDVVREELSSHSGVDREMVMRLEKVLKPEEQGHVHFRGDGCEACSGNGIVGKTVVAEVVLPDDEMRRMFRAADEIGAKRHWIQHGGKPILMHGIEKIISGSVSPVDVEERLGPVTTLMVMEDGILDKEELDYAGPSTEDRGSMERRRKSDDALSEESLVARAEEQINEELSDDFSDFDEKPVSSIKQDRERIARATAQGGVKGNLVLKPNLQTLESTASELLSDLEEAGDE